jgi:dTDP-4-dehydrorhamnose reductase
MLMKYLVLGSNGMAGHVMVLHLQDQGHEVDTVARSAGPFPETVVLDVRDTERLDELVKTGGYDVVVNCVGLLIGACEQNPADAVLINAHLPLHLAETLRHSATRLVHLSTDCVFSGHAGPYAESALYDGQRVYDRSKALGEVVNDKDLTVRMSIIGPELSRTGSGLFNWFIQQEGAISGFTAAKWNGITTVKLASAVEALAQTPTSGLVHIVPSDDSLTKHDLLVKMNNAFHRELRIKPQAGDVTDKRLLRTRNDVTFITQTYDEMLIEMREWINSRPQFYPHYHVAK